MSGLGWRQKSHLVAMVEDSGDGRRWAFHASTQRVMESLERRGLVEWTGRTTYWRKRHRKEYRATEKGRSVVEDR